MSAFNLTNFISESTEDVDTTDMKKIVIAPGRFNPPHRGHKSMFETLSSVSEQLNAIPVIIIVDSGKYDERNPLTGSVREEYINKMYPDVITVIAKNPYDAVVGLHDVGFIPVGGVCGKDRADSYKQMIGRIFGESIKDQYHDEILKRDPESDDIAGISASKVRESVKDGNRAAFRTMVDLPREDANALFNLIEIGFNRDAPD